MRKSAAVLFGLLVAGPAAPAVAAFVSAQPPCGNCVSFTPAQAIPVIRSFEFVPPGSGTATVTFHGSLYCSGTSSNMAGSQRARVDLVSQIVNRASYSPEIGKAGALRHAAGLEVPDPTGTTPSFTWFHTFNLTSTRVFQVNGTSQKYYFKIQRLVQENVDCHVSVAAFSVLSTP
jgi:hypothetical protein